MIVFVAAHIPVNVGYVATMGTMAQEPQPSFLWSVYRAFTSLFDGTFHSQNVGGIDVIGIFALGPFQHGVRLAKT